MVSPPLSLVQLLQQTGQLTPEETTQVLQIWQHTFQLQKNEFLSKPDRRDHYIYFVVSGVLRIYCVNRDGEEVCLGFSYDNSLTGSYPSLITGKPAEIYVQTLSACELIGAVWEDFVALTQILPNLERFRRILAEETLLGRMAREIEMLTLTPAERYEQFMQRSAHLVQIIPQKHIASYLGMTPETLSRVRKR